MKPVAGAWPHHRRCAAQGVGRLLAVAIIEVGRRRGHTRMRLDTPPAMVEGRTLHRARGFHPIFHYRHNPIAGTAFMQLAL